MTTTPKPPTMASRLATDLDRFAIGLRPFAEATGDRVAIAMLECCDFLLIEAYRLERGMP